MEKTVVIIGSSFAGIKAAWDLRHLLDEKHRILMLSDKPRTTFRPSFPRVLFENLSHSMSDGEVCEIELGTGPYDSKIRFEEIFMERRGDIGELHHQMIE
jgi:hypothetical protein